MLNNPPKEKERLYVILCSLDIFVTIPLARSMQKFVKENWGKEIFSYVVFAVVILAGS